MACPFRLRPFSFLQGAEGVPAEVMLTTGLVTTKQGSAGKASEYEMFVDTGVTMDEPEQSSRPSQPTRVPEGRDCLGDLKTRPEIPTA